MSNEKTQHVSRRDFLKLIGGAAGVLALGEWLENLNQNSKLAKKLATIELAISNHPEDELLKDAYLAFLSCHIAIAGAIAKEMPLAANNMKHYLYGEGKSRDISEEYARAIDRIGGVEKFLWEILSLSYNLQPQITGTLDWEETIQQMAKKKTPEFEDMSIVVSGVTLGDNLGFGLSRHTMRIKATIVKQREIETAETASRVQDIVKGLTQYEQKFRLVRFFLHANKPLSIYDKYVFKINESSGLGFSTEDNDLKTIMQVVNTFGGLEHMKSVLGEEKIRNSLLRGAISIDVLPLKKLEELGIAQPYEITAQLPAVDYFFVDVVMK